MSKLTYICIIFISVFFSVSCLMNDNSDFVSEEMPEMPLPLIEKKVKKGLNFNLYEDPEIEEMKALLEDHKGSSEPLVRAWSLLVDTYTSSDKVKEDFNLLKDEGFKAYIRHKKVNDKIIYTLHVGPNLDKKKMKTTKDTIASLHNKSPEIQLYQE